MLLAAFALGCSLHAQVVGGKIGGVITDQAGAPVSDAGVVIRNLETGSERRLRSDGNGSYAAPSMLVGRYSVSVEEAGFRRKAAPASNWRLARPCVLTCR